MTLPWHQHSFATCTFLPLITSTSHSSIISHCPSDNLLRLDMCQPSCDNRPEEDFEFVVQSEMPRIREFRTSESPLLTAKLLHAKRQGGRPAFDFIDLGRLSMPFTWAEDERNIQYLLQNVKFRRSNNWTDCHPWLYLLCPCQLECSQT